MRKILFIILICFASCEKEYCWECTIKRQFITPHVQTVTDYISETKCDMTEIEIYDYARINSRTEITGIDASGHISKIVYEYSCTR